MEEEEKIYFTKIIDREYKFILRKQADEKTWLIIPDCGGQADMVPKFQEQFNWINKKLKEIDGIKQIWGTIWEIDNKNALNKIKSILS